MVLNKDRRCIKKKAPQQKMANLQNIYLKTEATNRSYTLKQHLDFCQVSLIILKYHLENKSNTLQITILSNGCKDAILGVDH